MSAFDRNTEVEFRHEQTATRIRCGTRRRNGGNRRRARCSDRGSDRVGRPRRRDPVGSSTEGVEGRSALPLEVELLAKRQLDEAHAWWETNRLAAPNAIRDDFESASRMLAMDPSIGRRSVKTKRRNVRQMFLRRVGYIVYYRVIDSPPRLQILAFWHSRRGKGPPI